MGTLIFVTPGKFAGQHKILLVKICGRVCGLYGFKLYMLALVGRPSLGSYDACMVYWVQGASRRNCRQKQGKTSFSLDRVFCLVGIRG